jgi:hypothetical protein
LAFLEYVTYLKGESMFTEKWYIRAFDRPSAKGKVTGDVTPAYCTIGTKGIAYVKTLLHNPKIIWFIRNPLDRAISQLRMNISRAGVGENPLRKTWLEFTEDPVIRNRGMLSKYIPEWEKAFGPEHTLYLPYNEIADNPEVILRRVESFLQVPAYDSYRHLRTRRHESRIVDVPPYIEERLARIVRKEEIFLENRFGMDFIKSTRARVFPK